MIRSSIITLKKNSEYVLWIQVVRKVLTRIRLYQQCLDALQDMDYHLQDVLSENHKLVELIQDMIAEERESIWEH